MSPNGADLSMYLGKFIAINTLKHILFRLKTIVRQLHFLKKGGQDRDSESRQAWLIYRNVLTLFSLEQCRKTMASLTWHCFVF